MPETGRREINITTQTLVKIVLIGLILFFLWTIRDLLILIISAIVLASALEPMVSGLHQKKIPRIVSVLAVYIIAIGVIVFVGYLVLPPVGYEISQLSSNSGMFTAALQNKLAAAGISQQSGIVNAVTSALKTFTAQFTNGSGGLFRTTVGVFNGLIDIVTILVISFYLVLEQNSVKEAVVSVIPVQHQQHTIRLVEKIQKKIGRWLIGQFIVSASIFTLSLIGLTLLHVQYALVLAILAGIFELVPYIGPVISAVPAVFFAFVQSPPLAIAVAVLYLIIQKTEGYILVPAVMRRTIGVSPLVILVAILVGLKLAGIFGVFLAVPVVAGATTYLQGARSESAST